MARKQNDLQSGGRTQTTGFSKAGSNPVERSSTQVERPLPNQKPPMKSWLSNFTPKVEVVPIISEQILSANDKRNYLMLQNNSDTDIHVEFGVQATLDSYYIAAGGFIEWNIIVPMNAINVICEFEGKKLNVIEGIKV